MIATESVYCQMNESDLREVLKMPHTPDPMIKSKSTQWLDESIKFYTSKRKKIVIEITEKYGIFLMTLFPKYKDGLYNFTKTGDEFMRYLRQNPKTTAELYDWIAELLVVYNMELTLDIEKNSRLVFRHRDLNTDQKIVFA